MTIIRSGWFSLRDKSYLAFITIFHYVVCAFHIITMVTLHVKYCSIFYTSICRSLLSITYMLSKAFRQINLNWTVQLYSVSKNYQFVDRSSDDQDTTRITSKSCKLAKRLFRSYFYCETTTAIQYCRWYKITNKWHRRLFVMMTTLSWNTFLIFAGNIHVYFYHLNKDCKTMTTICLPWIGFLDRRHKLF